MLSRREFIAMSSASLVPNTLINSHAMAWMNDMSKVPWYDEWFALHRAEDIVGWHILRTRSACCGFVVREGLLPWPARVTEFEVMVHFVGMLLPNDIGRGAAGRISKIEMRQLAKGFEGTRFSAQHAAGTLVQLKRTAQDGLRDLEFRLAPTMAIS
jgi:hypothetical protein